MSSSTLAGAAARGASWRGVASVLGARGWRLPMSSSMSAGRCRARRAVSRQRFGTSARADCDCRGPASCPDPRPARWARCRRPVRSVHCRDPVRRVPCRGPARRAVAATRPVGPLPRPCPLGPWPRPGPCGLGPRARQAFGHRARNRERRHHIRRRRAVSAARSACRGLPPCGRPCCPNGRAAVPLARRRRAAARPAPAAARAACRGSC